MAMSEKKTSEKKTETAEAFIAHGGAALPAVSVDTYNAELREAHGFVGDRASKRAFTEILTDWRERLKRLGDDPFGDTPTAGISKKKLEKVLQSGDAEAAGLVQGAIEEFAQELAAVTRRFLRLKSWRDTERIVIGGGFRESRIGELAIGRTAVLLKGDNIDIELVPIEHHPDEAGLIGAIYLAPPWIFAGHDAILAVDIGGSNIRAGIIELRSKKKHDLADSRVVESELWRHRDNKPKRDAAVKRLIEMLEDLIDHAHKKKLKLAPFIGIGCPGIIAEDGAIERGGQNLPGNWESSRFNLPQMIRDGIPKIDGHDTVVVMHNDAVVQGLSEVPNMQDVKHWGVFTIGTGLGNARFTNKKGEN
jgi:predicted NBD/HSP70 family sugar kinase